MAEGERRTSLVLPTAVWTKWKLQAAREARPMRAVFLDALDLYLAAQRQAAKKVAR